MIFNNGRSLTIQPFLNAGAFSLLMSISSFSGGISVTVSFDFHEALHFVLLRY